MVSEDQRNVKIENIKRVLLNMATFLKERAEMLEAEAGNLKRCVCYTENDGICLNDTTTNQGETKSDFQRAVETVSVGIDNLIIMINGYLKNVENVINDIEGVTKVNSSLLIEHILLIDCMRERTHSLAEKLEYFHVAYENLVSGYNFLHLPIPTISRRVKASNLMLYLDKKITENYAKLKKDIFGIESNDSDNEKVFSTWNFSAHDHIKKIDDSGNTYISFNFWLLEKQYFYPIAYHEIGHSLYRTLIKCNVDPNNVLLGRDAMSKIISKLYIARKTEGKNKGLTMPLVPLIYQDIICDLSAYALTGSAYIFSLFYTGFIRGLHKNFYKDLTQESLILEKDFSVKDRECKERHENLTLLTWTNVDIDMISFFVRLHILIDLHEEIFGPLQSDDHLKAIRDVLDVVYHRPGQHNTENFTTFANVVSASDELKRQYNLEKSFVMLAYLLLKEEINKRRVIDIVKQYRFEKKKRFKQKYEKFKEVFLEILYVDKADDYDIFEKYDPGSYFEYIWALRYDQIVKKLSKNKSIDFSKLYSGRLMRCKNLQEIGLLNPDSAFSLDSVIYELVFFKFRDNSRKLIEFKSNEFDGNNINEVFDEEGRVTYAFGPYDLVYIGKKTTREIDSLLREIDKNENINPYFTERHALYMLRDKEGDVNSDFPLDLMIMYSSPYDFANIKHTRTEFNEIEELTLNSCKKYYKNAKIFSSMGNENFLIYFEGLSSYNLKKITDMFIADSALKGNTYSTVLLNKNINKNMESRKNGKSVKTILTLLYKYKRKLPDNPDDKDQNDSKIIDFEKKIWSCLEDNKKLQFDSAYRLLGIFDGKILLEVESEFSPINDQVYNLVECISNYFSDLQIEYQLPIAFENERDDRLELEN